MSDRDFIANSFWFLLRNWLEIMIVLAFMLLLMSMYFTHQMEYVHGKDSPYKNPKKEILFDRTLTITDKPMFNFKTNFDETVDDFDIDRLSSLQDLRSARPEFNVDVRNPRSKSECSSMCGPSKPCTADCAAWGCSNCLQQPTEITKKDQETCGPGGTSNCATLCKGECTPCCKIWGCENCNNPPEEKVEEYTNKETFCNRTPAIIQDKCRPLHEKVCRKYDCCVFAGKKDKSGDCVAGKPDGPIFARNKDGSKKYDWYYYKNKKIDL